MVSTLPCADTTPPTADQPARHLDNHHQRHARLERLHRQRRRRRLRHLPRHHQGRHRHHDHLHLQRTHLRHHLQHRRRAVRRRRQHLHRRRPMSVTTSACTDTQPPRAPTQRQRLQRAPQPAISLTWTPATDNIGVAGYGIYNGANLIDTTGTAHHRHHQRPHLRHQLHPLRRRHRRNGQQLPPKTTIQWSPPSPAPTPPRRPSRQTSEPRHRPPPALTLAWNAASDNVAVTGYDVLRGNTKVGLRHHPHHLITRSPAAPPIRSASKHSTALATAPPRRPPRLRPPHAPRLLRR